MINTAISECVAGLRITVLVDNHIGDALIAEHGLSFLVEVGDKSILFDTGQSCVVENNASILGIAFNQLDMIVLSHGHYDHTGGLPYVLAQSPKIHVYGHPDIKHLSYSIKDGYAKPIHMPQAAADALEQLTDDQFIRVDHPTVISDRVELTGPIPRKTDYEDTGGPFFLDPEGLQPDPIDDDLAMWIRTDEGIVVCVGCSHSGIINILNYINELTGNEHIRAVLGGFHLLHANRHRLEQTITALKKLNIDLLVPCHCTGEQAQIALRKAFRERVLPDGVGRVYHF